MKVAVPVESKSLNIPICHSLGRAPFFALFDIKSGNYEFLNNDAATDQGGAGIKAAQILIDNKAAALITYLCGKNAAEILNTANIKIYKAINNSAADNIRKLKNGELSLLTEVHAGFHNHGGEK